MLVKLCNDWEHKNVTKVIQTSWVNTYDIWVFDGAPLAHNQNSGTFAHDHEIRVEIRVSRE